MRTQALFLPTALILLAANVPFQLAFGQESANAAVRREDDPMKLENGFRYDPMAYVRQSRTVQAALIRRQLFKSPIPEDAEIIRNRIEEIIAAQNEDGTLGDSDHDRSAALMELAELGADPNRPEVKRAIEASLRELPKQNWIRDERALCMWGVTGLPEVKAALQAAVDNQEGWNGPYKLCPWGQDFYLNALWDGRDLVDSEELIANALTWMADGLNEVGCQSYKDPWGFVWSAGMIQTPEARRLVERLVPTILRGQRSDGSWGHEPYGSWSRNSLSVFRALVNHDLFDRLRELPPLPPDWQVSREIPTPSGDLFSLTWGANSLWVLDRKAALAIAISTDDGSVQRQVKIPFDNPAGIGWWGNGLGVTQKDPKRWSGSTPRAARS